MVNECVLTINSTLMWIKLIKLITYINIIGSSI